MERQFKDRIFYEILVSSQPNNDCELCSFFSPPERIKDPEFDFPYSDCSGWIGYRSPTHCPSCQRSCDRFFVTEEQIYLFKRVPDDYPKKWVPKHYKRSEDFWETAPPPLQPRSCFDLEEYNQRIEAVKTRLNSTAAPSQKSEPKAKSPAPVILTEAKPVAFRLKIGGPKK